MQATIFNNVNSITINDMAPANLYPSPIVVSGMSGSVTSIKVKINNLSHAWVHDVSFILQAPSGESLLLQSGTADGLSASNLTYTISDAGATQFSSNALWNNNGTYKPTGYFWDMWAAPAPPTPPGLGTYNAPGPFGPQTATLASTFNGLSPNGTWKLFVADFGAGDAGVIAGGWSLDISSGLPLHVDLQTFYGSRVNDINRLVWETSNETNFSHFELEHSADNLLFTSIANIDGKAPSIDPNKYHFEHKEANAAINYYRLKMIDQDFLYGYSKVVAIQSNPKYTGINTFPTVVQHEFQVHSENEVIRNLTLHDYMGRLVFARNPNDLSFTFIRQECPLIPGFYILSVFGNESLLSKTVLQFQ
ncbi:MAG: hypothetical protein IPK62_12930 [Bacteroidetes bacterium]|nr:hypothetical protein [Bacteroidota bacterium]